MLSKKLSLFPVVILLMMVFWSHAVECVRFEEDVSITFEQKVAIDKLKRRVQPYTTEEYMKEDIFLVRWLRVADFDVSLAERKLIENIKWRKENKMATIDQEDYSDVAENFPYTNNGLDREGRPVFIVFVEKDSKLSTGREKCTKLFNEMENLHKSIHLSIVEFLQSYENHYPGMADKILIINAPPAVHFVIELARQTVSKETRAAIQVYGTNKEQWQGILQKYVDKKYLPVEFGGTAARD